MNRARLNPDGVRDILDSMTPLVRVAAAATAGLFLAACGSHNSSTATSPAATSVAANGTATLTAPSKPGTYPFHCSIHTQMLGTLVVKP